MWRLAVVVALTLKVSAVLAQSSYPDRIVRVIVPSPGGGATDVVARVVVESISQRLGRNWAIIENVGVSGGAVGLERVKRAEPDGYTILVGGAGNLTVAPFVQRVSYDARTDFVPVILLNRIPVIAIANKAAGFTSLSDVFSKAKGAPGSLSWATGGRGILPYLVGLAALKRAGAEMVNIPYRGEAAAVTDIVGGHVNFGLVGLASAASLIRSGDVVALGVSSGTRNEDYPSIPPFAEALPGFDITGWYAVLAPVGTPSSVVKWLNEQFNAALAAPDVRERLRDLGTRPAGGEPSVLAREIENDLKTYEDVVRAFDIKPQ